MNLKTLSLASMAIAVLAGGLSLAALAEGKNVAEPVVDNKLASADNAMGFSMLAELRKDSGDKNVFISPLSIGIALQMTYNGAGGNTAKEMAAALKLGDMDLNTLNAANKDLRLGLTSNDKLTVRIANAIFTRAGEKFGADFLKRNNDFFNAQVEALDFKDPATVEYVNKWCAKNTNDKITSIIKDIDPADMMFLINAVYFKGNWKYQFKKESTKEGDFTLTSGEKVKAQMMNQRMDVQGLMGDNFMAGKLPYEDGHTHMYVFIPDDAKGLADFCARLNADQWKKWIDSFGQHDNTRIALPRFKVEYESTLNKALQAMGMKDAFVFPKADFGAIRADGAKDLYISEVLHKTFVEVNEEGTEAAAVTSVRMAAGSAAPKRFYNLVADKPFFYAICDDTTGAILFMGTMNNPKS